MKNYIEEANPRDFFSNFNLYKLENNSKITRIFFFSRGNKPEALDTEKI